MIACRPPFSRINAQSHHQSTVAQNETGTRPHSARFEKSFKIQSNYKSDAHLRLVFGHFCRCLYYGNILNTRCALHTVEQHSCRRERAFLYLLYQRLVGFWSHDVPLVRVSEQSSPRISVDKAGPCCSSLSGFSSRASESVNFFNVRTALTRGTTIGDSHISSFVHNDTQCFLTQFHVYMLCGG